MDGRGLRGVFAAAVLKIGVDLLRFTWSQCFGTCGVPSPHAFYIAFPLAMWAQKHSCGEVDPARRLGFSRSLVPWRSGHGLWVAKSAEEEDYEEIMLTSA